MSPRLCRCLDRRVSQRGCRGVSGRVVDAMDSIFNKIVDPEERSARGGKKGLNGRPFHQHATASHKGLAKVIVDRIN